MVPKSSRGQSLLLRQGGLTSADAPALRGRVRKGGGAALIILVLTVATAACTSPAPKASSDISVAPSTPSRTAVFLTHVEPISLSEHRALYTTGSNPVDAKRLFNASLTLADYQGVPQPYLIERRPEQ